MGAAQLYRRPGPFLANWKVDQCKGLRSDVLVTFSHPGGASGCPGPHAAAADSRNHMVLGPCDAVEPLGHTPGMPLNCCTILALKVLLTFPYVHVNILLLTSRDLGGCIVESSLCVQFQKPGQ